ncbi:hypothetical protein D3C81_1554290 [compost metagenome]
MPADFPGLVAAGPDQPHMACARLQARHAHVSHQLFVRHDARHRLAEAGAVHGDVAEHAPRAGLDVARRMQAEQRVAGAFGEIAEQAFVGLAGQALGVVAELLAGQAGGLEGGVDLQAELFGVTQVFMQGGNRSLAEGMHRIVLVLLSRSVTVPVPIRQ